MSGLLVLVALPLMLLGGLMLDAWTNDDTPDQAEDAPPQDIEVSDSADDDLPPLI
jgi:hypothetical protein